MSIDELVALFDVIDIAPDDFPVRCSIAKARMPSRWPTAALPHTGRIGCGSSVSLRDAHRAAVGEAIEIASLAVWDEESLVPEQAHDNQHASHMISELLGFSSYQIAEREGLNTCLAELDNIPIASRLEEREWILARDAWTDENVFVPAASVYLDYRGDRPSMADTNGCAAAEDNETAKLRALLEAIERDATGRWWYAQRARSRVAPGDSYLFEKLQSRDFSPRLYDITSDIGVPVVAAAGTVSNKYVALGFGAGLSHETAAEKALSEMAMMALKLEGAVHTGWTDASLSIWMSEARPETPPLSSSNYAGTCPCSLNGLEEVLQKCRRAKIRLAFFDQSRSEFGLKVWRAISPDLCHWKPRFGKIRLLAKDSRDLSRSDTLNPVLLRV